MESKIYTVYASFDDMTFIMKDEFDNEEVKSTEVVGFYFGEPNEEATKLFTNKLKAEY